MPPPSPFPPGKYWWWRKASKTCSNLYLQFVASILIQYNTKQLGLSKIIFASAFIEPPRYLNH
jgi:hypothetical protein